MDCDHQYVSTKQTRFVTGPGLFGTLLFLVGIPLFLISPIFGLCLVVGGILIAMIGRKAEVIVCAKCGGRAPHQPS